MKNPTIVVIKVVVFIAGLLCGLAIADPSYADAPAGPSAVSQIVTQFHSRLASYEQVMLKYAKLIFYWCAVLEVAYLGIKAALGASDIGSSFKNFCLALLTAGFCLAVINKYHEWIWNIINGLQKIAGESTTLINASDEPFTIGISLADELFEKT